MLFPFRLTESLNINFRSFQRLNDYLFEEKKSNVLEPRFARRKGTETCSYVFITMPRNFKTQTTTSYPYSQNL